MRVAAFGEGMLELRGGLNAGPVAGQLFYGGDVLNTAIYMARLGVTTHFVSALGIDPYSRQLRAAWEDEGVATGDVLSDPERLPGLYGVVVGDRGEREFYYWRALSAARAFFSLSGAPDALERAARADLFYLSLITLSIFTPDEQRRIGALVAAVRAAGGIVAFDLNYRARGWRSAREARLAVDAVAPHVSIAMPSREDCAALFGDASGPDAARRWRDLGASEIVLKQGDADMIVIADGREFAVPSAHVERPVDTTGAGDAFNAAYLTARCARGASAHDAAVAGAALAARVICYPGAIIPRAAMPAASAPGREAPP